MTRATPKTHWRCALAGLLLATACGGGGSGSSDPVDLSGVWRGTVAYDENSCSSPLVPPESVTRQDFRITVSSTPVGPSQCPGLATDQYDQVYLPNGPQPCPVETDSEVTFIPQRDTGDPTPTRPTGIIFRNVREDSAVVSVSYFVNLSIGGSCVVVFRGTFSRQ